MDKQQIRAKILANVTDYVVINDGGATFFVDRDDLHNGETERSLKALSDDAYQAWCQDVSADQRYAGVGSGENTKLCNDMLDAGAEYWCIG
jgi:hypothetical protein